MLGSHSVALCTDHTIDNHLVCDEVCVGLLLQQAPSFEVIPGMFR
jgi:hypothetical protein